MTESDIYTHHVLKSIYDLLIGDFQYYQDSPKKIATFKRQVLDLIQKILTQKFLEYYHAPHFCCLTTNDSINRRLDKYLRQSYESQGKFISPEELEELKGNILDLLSQFVESQIKKEEENE